MSRWSFSRQALAVMFASFLVSACGGSSSPPATDYRGDPLCQSPTILDGASCQLSVSMHGHTYLLSCDLSQGSCGCRLDGRPAGASGFGGSTTPACTTDFLDLEWSECCGTPD
jgi:hypothetical protein